jgi:hypothetical protein
LEPQRKVKDRGCVISIVDDSRRPSVRLLGDDPLMLRALSRLLGGVGYEVSVGQLSWVATAPILADCLTCSDLTIVDVPDDWSRSVLPGDLARDPIGRPTDSVLWLSNAAIPGENFERCLAKPFTADELLARVACLVGSSSSVNPSVPARRAG